MKKRTLLYIVAALFFTGIGVFVGTRNMPAQAVQTPEARIMSSLFAQTLPDEKGQPQSLAQWQNKPVIINFWATWCAPCVEEMPELMALQSEIGSTQIIGIGIDSQSNIAQFAEKLHIDYPLYVADIGMINLLRQLGNETGGLPFTVVMSEGTVKKIYLGRLQFDELRQDLSTFKMM